MTSPVASGGRWLRCALHAHTTNSDGELAPQTLVRHCDRARFDVLAITDHRVRIAAARFTRVEVEDTAGRRAWTNPL